MNNEERIEVSRCHRASIIYIDETEENSHFECSHCKRTCEAEEVCVYCLGTKEISTNEEDGQGHTERGVGTAPCPGCTVKMVK